MEAMLRARQNWFLIVIHEEFLFRGAELDVFRIYTSSDYFQPISNGNDGVSSKASFHLLCLIIYKFLHQNVTQNVRLLVTPEDAKQILYGCRRRGR